MLNWLKRLPGNKTAKPPAADKLDFDRLPLLSARGLIELTGQYGRLAHIKRIVQIDDATWQMLYQEVIERFAGLVQLMPASQAHHHAVPGGLFVHTLEVLEYALTGRQQYKLPLFASEKQQEDERHLWTYAVFLAAILHDVGKRLTLCRLILDDGRELPPFSGDPATLAGRHYRIVFNDPKYHALHEQIGLAFAGHLLPPLAQDFILPRLHVMQQLMGHIHGNPDAADIIGKIVREADQKSTGESLQHIPARQFKGATLENIGERLMTRLRHLLADNRFAINTRNGNVYTTGDYYSGYTWILSKTLADTLRQSLNEDGQTDIPHDNNRIFDILGEHGFAERNADGKVMHYLKRTLQGKSDTYTVLKFRTARLLTTQPPPFPGDLAEVAGREESAPAYTAATKTARTAAAGGQKPAPAVAPPPAPATAPEPPDTFSDSTFPWDGAATPPQPTPATAAQTPVPATGTTPAPADDPFADPPGSETLPPAASADDPFADPATGSTTPPVPATGGANTPATAADTATAAAEEDPFAATTTAAAPEAAAGKTTPPPATDADQEAEPATGDIPADLGERFLAWCRAQIRARNIVINESNSVINKVRYQGRDVIAAVTPRTYFLFGDTLGLAQDKSTATRIQSVLHKNKSNIPAPAGQIHRYQIKKSENNPLGGHSILSFYLFEIEKFAGDDTAVKAIIDSVPTNGNLEPATPKNKDGAGKKKPAKKAGGSA